MKQFIEKNKERRKLIKQGFKNCYLCYNYLSGYYKVLLFSKEFIQKRFKIFEIVI